MKRVYVETNFLVDLLRPFPARAAKELHELHQDGGLRLTVPWCALKEAQRTFERVIRDDVGFEDLAGKAWAHLRPTADNGLGVEYDQLGIRVLAGFALPRD